MKISFLDPLNKPKTSKLENNDSYFNRIDFLSFGGFQSSFYI